MRPAIFVPETKLIVDLLRELRARKVHIAVVLDEYGGTSGLVSIEDILEEIVGEIVDEYESPTLEPIVRLDSRTMEVDAKVRIEQLAENLGIEMTNNQDVDTVGGLVFSLLGSVPKRGQVVEHQQLRFTVLDAERRKINRLRVELQPPPENEQNEA
jgi:CBS domain containing-hemolysin-like protein